MFTLGDVQQQRRTGGMIWRLSIPNNFVAYGQNYKVWVLIFLVMEERNTLTPSLGGLDEIFVFCNTTA